MDDSAPSALYEGIRALRLERRGGVLAITLDNPPMNANTRAGHAELARIFEIANHDEATKVIVITGAGTRAFSAGGDIDAMVERIEQRKHGEWNLAAREAAHVVNGLLRLQKPLIARINGHAMGFGATVAALSDFSYMMADAKIADTHVKVGLAAGDGGAAIWPLLVGFVRAKRYLLTGEALTGRQAAEIGLITEAVDSFEQLDERTWAMANQLASGPTVAINTTKMAINLVLRRILEGVIETHMGYETASYLTNDHYEAAKAFREKRPPKFTGT
jgi:enoyl-CoA hydratase